MVGRRRRELDELEVLARRVWGDGYYEQYMGSRSSRWARARAAIGIGIGVPMLLTASLLSFFVSAASAHTSTIDISCTAVEFAYQDFPATTATAHEVVSIDGVAVAVRDFTFVGPSGADTIAISIGFGTHRVEATTEWTFDGAVQGSDSDSHKLTHCSSTSTTTAPEYTTTTTPHHTSTSVKSTTSTSMPGVTTTSSPETTSTVGTSTSTPPSSTSTTLHSGTTTTTGHGSTTTTGESTTSTTSPVHSQGSTTTTSPVHPHGSTVPPGESTMSPPTGNLPFTGSARGSLISGLFTVGVGLLALGLTSLRRARAGSGE